jgi:pyridoxamine 5'-phosphate oxidase
VSVDPPAGPASMRRAYGSRALTEDDLASTWLAQFERWFSEAIALGLPEPNAMILATAAGDGQPNARTVLLKGVDEGGFVLYTNLASRKGEETRENPRAALVFPWHPIERQVRVSGAVRAVEEATADAYFASRPRGAQLGAHASAQSQVIAGRAVLDERLAAAAAAYPGAVPRPPDWGGLRVVPDEVEFWQGRPDRLHDRLRYRRTLAEGEWVVERLAP